jgi:hypothetical protein
LKMPGRGICPRSRDKQNTWNIRNIPPIERGLMFHINKMFRNTATTWNTKRRMKKAMFHVFRMFRMI